MGHIGSFAYNMVLELNRHYNRYRRWRGKEYWSLSSYVKGMVKQAAQVVSNFEMAIARSVIGSGCDGVICGHIHAPVIKMIAYGTDLVDYYNTGDWV